MMPNFEILGSLVRDLHFEFQRIYFLMLPVFFSLSLLVAWVKNPAGGPDFIDTLKRAIISTLLLVAFQDIAQGIVSIADGIAQLIDNQGSLNTFIRMAQEKASSYTHSSNVLLLQFDDLIIAVLSFASFLFLYVARYVTIAMYHFMWIFLSVSAPLILLFNMFPATSQITKNLFRGMIEVASWKIVWAILSAMLRALAFGNIYATEGSYITLMVMNFVIAIAMLATPMVVKSLVGSGLQSMAEPIGLAAVAAAFALPARVMTVAANAKGMATAGRNFAANTLRYTYPRLGPPSTTPPPGSPKPDDPKQS